MFESVALATALIGSSLAAAWDLRTTEIPDQIPHAMIVAALLLYALQSYTQWSYLPILYSLIAGLSLLGFGFLMYYLGQWGGGDAKILAAIGFLLPLQHSSTRLLFPFPLSYLINVFLVGAVYMLGYAAVLAAKNKRILTAFKSDIKASSSVFIVGSFALFGLFLAVNFYLANYFHIHFGPMLFVNALLPSVATVALFLVWKFAKAVENVGFKKRIPVSKLRVGDVLLKSKLWEGITEKELRAIRRSKKSHVWIKEGVRFAPAFPLALLFTLYLGDAFLVFVKLLI